MSEAPKPKPRIDSSILAALIGLAGTIVVALTSIFANRPVSIPVTATPVTTAVEFNSCIRIQNYLIILR